MKKLSKSEEITEENNWKHGPKFGKFDGCLLQVVKAEKSQL